MTRIYSTTGVLRGISNRIGGYTFCCFVYESMQCDAKLLAELKYLVTQKHSWRRNNLRTNLAIDKANDIVVDGTWRKLKKGVYSNGVREGQSPAGDRMFQIVREILPHATVNALQLNRNVVCGRHKDAKHH